MMCHPYYQRIFQLLGRTCDMARSERRERERKAAARTCLSTDAFHPRRENLLCILSTLHLKM